MKYPKHLILDLSTPTAMPRLSLYRQRKRQKSPFPSDKIVLRRLGSVKHTKTLFDLVNLTYASSSPDVSGMLSRIAEQKRHRYDPWLLTNTHILVKEKLYTKLKFSKSFIQSLFFGSLMQSLSKALCWTPPSLNPWAAVLWKEASKHTRLETHFSKCNIFWLFRYTWKCCLYLNVLGFV